MSSVTISTTVWPLDQPCSSTVGVKTRTLAVPTGRLGQGPVAGGGAEQVLGLPGQQVLGGDVLVVADQEPGEVVPTLSFGQLRSLAKHLGAGFLQRARHCAFLVLSSGGRRCPPPQRHYPSPLVGSRHSGQRAARVAPLRRQSEPRISHSRG